MISPMLTIASRKACLTETFSPPPTMSSWSIVSSRISLLLISIFMALSCSLWKGSSPHDEWSQDSESPFGAIHWPGDTRHTANQDNAAPPFWSLSHLSSRSLRLHDVDAIAHLLPRRIALDPCILEGNILH